MAARLASARLAALKLPAVRAHQIRVWHSYVANRKEVRQNNFDGCARQKARAGALSESRRSAIAVWPLKRAVLAASKRIQRSRCSFSVYQTDYLSNTAIVGCHSCVI